VGEFVESSIDPWEEQWMRMNNESLEIKPRMDHWDKFASFFYLILSLLLLMFQELFITLYSSFADANLSEPRF
jgi:hypothetical protein